MKTFEYKGVTVREYTDFDDAFADFYTRFYPNDVTTPEQYHERYFLFLTGAIHALSLMGSRTNEKQLKGEKFTPAVLNSLIQTLNEATAKNPMEYAKSGVRERQQGQPSRN